MIDLQTLINLSKLDGQEQIIKISETKAVRYRVVKEEIDLETLKQEKRSLEEQLAMKEPTDEELIMEGRIFHPYYQRDKSYLEQRIEEINKILGK